jgi:cation transport regulator
MPYSSVTELPENVKSALSEHEQELFLAAFNSAFEQYKDEETAFKVAWAAVKRKEEGALPEPVREAERPKIRMLNVSLSDYTKFQETDGGLLVKDVILLAEGTWTDSSVQTPLYYPAAILQKDAGNWKERGLWARHAGKAPRSITDKVGSIKDPHYDPQYRAIMGDLFFHCRTQVSKDASELVRCGEVNAVSVEHGGEERYNAAAQRYDAVSLDFYGCALVDMGACEVCKIRHNQGTDAPAPQTGKEQDSMDDECKKAISELSGRIKALEDAMKPKDEPKEEPKKEAEKPAPPVVDIAGEIAKALEPIAMRLNALEKKPEPRSLQPKAEEPMVTERHFPKVTKGSIECKM